MEGRKSLCQTGMWKRSFFCGNGSAKNLSLPHRLFDLKSFVVLYEKVLSIFDVDLTVKLHNKSE